MGKLTAEQLLSRAREYKVGSRAPGYGDNKAECYVEDIITLLDAGAQVRCLNSEQIGGGDHVHEVEFEGHVFVAGSREPVEELKKYQR